jgi:toxin-antitoxin system PIN domain toxin
MSYSVDVNVLLYASDQASPRYDEAMQFLLNRASDPELFCISWSTLMAYVRISTHPSIFSHPLSPEEALKNVEILIRQPRVRVLSEDDGFLVMYREVTSLFPVRGNLVPDAHLAALLLQHGVRKIYTADSDFRKFEFLEVSNPFSS